MSIELTYNATAKLEPFLLMAKSARGAAAAKLVQDATSAHGVFVFSELLDVPSIQELGRGEHAAYFALLQLFAFRTFEDYKAQKNSLPPLNHTQIIKLKHLSLISLSAERRILPYSLLLQALDMPTIRELEDLIIDAIYLDIIRGKLDQREKQFEVEFTIGRDLEPRKIDNLLRALKDWSNTTSSILDALDIKLNNLASQKAEAKMQLEEHERIYQANIQEILDKDKSAKGGKRHQQHGPMLHVPQEDRMDVDEPLISENPKGKNRKTVPSESTKTTRKRNRF